VRVRDVSAAGPPRVLVVDDEDSIVDAVAAALRYEAYDVAQAVQRPGRTGDCIGARAEPNRARLDAPGHRRHRGRAEAARPGTPAGDPLPDRAGAAEPGEVLEYGDVVLDEMRHEVRRGERLVPLRTTGFSLLRYFMLNPRRVLSKGQIIERAEPSGRGQTRV
jgi:DNA-binding response OmpR family regulator